MSFWKDGFSIDESNKSMLIIGLFGSLLVMWGYYLVTGYIDPIFTDVVKTLAYCVAGVNGVKTIDNTIGSIVKKVKG